MGTCRVFACSEPSEAGLKSQCCLTILGEKRCEKVFQVVDLRQLKVQNIMSDDFKNKRPPTIPSATKPLNRRGIERNSGTMNSAPTSSSSPEPMTAPEQKFKASPSGFTTDLSASFQAVVSKKQSDSDTADDGEFEVSPKVRAIYGASAFFGASIVGLFLGFLNSALQGVDILAELGTAIEITLWFASFVGLLGALMPKEFEQIFENIRQKIEG